MSGSWIDTLQERMAKASEPRSLDELNPPPASQPAVGGPTHADVAALVAKEVNTQMESFIGRLEHLFAPTTPTNPAPVTTPEAPSAPVTPATDPAGTNTQGGTVAAPEAAQGGSQTA